MSYSQAIWKASKRRLRWGFGSMQTPCHPKHRSNMTSATPHPYWLVWKSYVNWNFKGQVPTAWAGFAARLLCCCSQKVKMRRHLHRHLWIPNQGSYWEQTNLDLRTATTPLHSRCWAPNPTNKQKVFPFLSSLKPKYPNSEIDELEPSSVLKLLQWRSKTLGSWRMLVRMREAYQKRKLQILH